MSENFTNVFMSDNIFTLESYLRNKHEPDYSLLKLEEDRSFTVTGKDINLENSVKFYVDRLIDEEFEIYRFRPIDYSVKYLAVSGNSLVLKDPEEVTDFSNRFIVKKVSDDYKKFQSFQSLSSTPMYITAHEDGQVSLEEGDDDSRSHWFHVNTISEMVEVTEVTNITAVEFMLSELNISLDLRNKGIATEAVEE